MDIATKEVKRIKKWVIAMKSRIKSRNVIIIVLCTTIVLLCLGFLSLSFKLQKYENEKNTFHIIMKKVEKNTFVKGGNNAPIGTYHMKNNGISLDMKFELFSPKDEIAYTITLVNTGTIPARIVDLAESQSTTQIAITHDKIAGKVLQPNEELPFSLVVLVDNKEKFTPTTMTYQLNILADSGEDES